MTTENQDELKLREQEDGSVVVGGEPAAEKLPEENDDEGEDNRNKASAEDGDEEQGHAEETAEEADARRERNRKRRAENKERRKDYIESLKRELAARDSIINDLATRVSSVERTATGSQMAQIDAAIREAENNYKELQDINKQAIEQANGEVAVAAQDRMLEARARHAQLTDIKKNLVRQPSQPQALDPRLKQHAEAWAEKNKWFDPSGKDTDSRIALTIDSQLAQEGWTPTTPEYWEELSARVKKYLPHRANSGYNQGNRNKPAGSPVAGSGRETSNSTKGTGYRLSQDRVNALKEAGIWDDPTKRAEAIKRYQEYDKQSSN